MMVLMSSSRSGQIINGYQIGPLLGAGGMGEVYQASRPDRAQPLAIKFLRLDAIDQEAAAQGRFIREMRILQALDHPNIISILDQGIVDGQLYYVMPQVRGMTLNTLQRRVAFSPLAFQPVFQQLASALAYAHEQNVVHRDLKPSNIFIERRGDSYAAFLGDFGLGKREGQDHTLTEAGAVLGTPHYMAPEVILGEKAAVAADIYSLGVMVYEVLTGRLPFESQFAHSVAMAHVTQAPPPPSEFSADFPPPLEAFLLRCLEKSPENRYASVREMLQAYEDALSQLSPEQAQGQYQKL